jgi:hypothetical protein
VQHPPYFLRLQYCYTPNFNIIYYHILYYPLLSHPIQWIFILFHLILSCPAPFNSSVFNLHLSNLDFSISGLNNEVKDDDDDDDEGALDVGIRDDVFRQRQRQKLAAQ